MEDDPDEDEVGPTNITLHDAGEKDPGAGTPQQGLCSKNMALITSDCGIMCSLSIKWP